jgi:hypothetical protein
LHFSLDVVRADDAPAEVLASVWAADDGFLWLLANARPLRRPWPCKGALGFWRPPTGLRLR